MAARAGAAIESIELPEVDSEYSDSDDECRPRTFDPPPWAKSPDLRQALEVQRTINPDNVFGPIGPVKIDELFPNRSGSFSSRASSENWTGTDLVLAEEDREYVRRMGFR
ncbi:hypothetical protein B0H13DRAFT_1591826 [Mycena leptocephala]|nr:hypothetical protein B0H13DRAFT_1648215 [Mycena leptocephala]KAJ7934094.1 hypothetical protein B0H13DRAFT_1591826 [Mycena leptocephala]